MLYLRKQIFTKSASIIVGICLSLTVTSVWLATRITPNEDETLSPRFRRENFVTDQNLQHTLPSERKFDCAKLFNGDKDEMKLAVTYLKSKKNSLYFNGSFTKMPLNCEEYKNSRGYLTNFSSKVEEDFPIAFNILFHKGFEQLERLLRAIYRPEHQFCIHIDRKTSVDIFEAVEMLTDCFDNVFIASKLEIVVYEGFTRLVADINCMKDHIERNSKWKYLINMAASEFPLMSNLQIVQILTELNGVNHIDRVLLHTNQDRYRKKHFTYIDHDTLTGRMINTRERKQGAPHGLYVTKGSAYGIFSRAFVEFILTDTVSRDLLAWLADTSVSEEHYWPTLNNLYQNPTLKTPGGYRGHPDKNPYFGRFIRWNYTIHAGQCKDKNYVHNICLFSVQDLPMLKHAHEIIANKFDLEYDPIAYGCMEEWVYNKTIEKSGIKNMRIYAGSFPENKSLFRI